MLARGAFLVLLCLNLTAALWWGLHRPLPTPTPAPGEPGVPLLTLLAEAERDAQPAAELAVAPMPLAESLSCLSIGPFETPSALRRAVDALGGAVGRLQYREAQVQSLRGWRVYLPAAASRAEALARARALAAQGFRDYYVVTAGPGENTVSLGMFRERGNAESRLAELQAAGVEAVMVAANEERPKWWLEIAVAPELDWRALLGNGRWQARPIPCF